MTNYIVSVAEQTPDGIVSRLWAVSKEQAEKIALDLGPENSEMFAPRDAAEGLADSAHASGAVFVDDRES